MLLSVRLQAKLLLAFDLSNLTQFTMYKRFSAVLFAIDSRFCETLTPTDYADSCGNGNGGKRKWKTGFSARSPRFDH